MTSKRVIEYGSISGTDDAPFVEWWNVKEDGRVLCECPTEADAKRIVAALEEADWKAWDEQIERDAAAGKLDAIEAQAVADHKAGKTKEI